MPNIPFSRPYLTGNEITYIADALNRGHLSGDGYYTKRCSELLQKITGSKRVLLTHSCTAALEMAAILANIGPGDEVIMPSFTFVSTANAFVLRGATPVFVDIRPDTLNLDERLVEAAITSTTRAIVPVHYAGVSCDMTHLRKLSKQYGLLIIEDAAQGILAYSQDEHLGSMGELGAISFHESKNISAGEAGALLINDLAFAERAEIIREKGTNRSRFFRGQVDKYTWVDIGSSYLPPEVTAAFLLAQLEKAKSIIEERVKIWQIYHDAFRELERTGRVTRPTTPSNARHNGHIYYLLLRDAQDRATFMRELRAHGAAATFHYVPLHLTDFGRTHSRACGDLSITTTLAERLVRLPLWNGIGDQQNSVADTATRILRTT